MTNVFEFICGKTLNYSSSRIPFFFFGFCIVINMLKIVGKLLI